jgi:hypothetical protein
MVVLRASIVSLACGSIFLLPTRLRAPALTFSIPLGNTAMLGGWTTIRQGDVEREPQIDSQVPYLSRLFAGATQNEEIIQIAILATPRVRKNADPDPTKWPPPQEPVMPR